MLAKRRYKNVTLDTWQGDITHFAVDVMTTAANEALEGGGGVDHAIHTAAGSELLAACQRVGGCKTGSAVVTDSFNLPCSKVIHAVGPVFKDGSSGESELLFAAYQKVCELFWETELRHLSLPAISTGVYGYPKQQAAQISWQAIYDFIGSADHEKINGRRITAVLFDEQDYTTYTNSLLSFPQDS